MKPIETIGENTISTLYSIGEATLLMFSAVVKFFSNYRNWSSLIEQIHFMGVMSLPLIMMSAFFIGMVFTVQTYIVLQGFGAESEVGLVFALCVFRELGPVITGLLFVGRAGSSVTAELGLMKTTDQITSMKLMSVDPIARVVSPKLVAMIISLPMLTIIFNWVSIIGSGFVAQGLLGMDGGTYWSMIRNGVFFMGDVLPGLLKASVFGLLVGWVSFYHGLYGVSTPTAVAKNATKTVVQGSMLILAFDYILVSFLGFA
jgi:phospholipid/cholesterol/gamma-HCH transport system permease protein